MRHFKAWLELVVDNWVYKILKNGCVCGLGKEWGIGMMLSERVFSASSVRGFMESREHRASKVACEFMLGLGALTLPPIFSAIARELQLPEIAQLLDRATTLPNFTELSNDFCDWILAESGEELTEGMQEAFYMCFYAAYFDSIRNYFCIEGHVTIDYLISMLVEEQNIACLELEEADRPFFVYSEQEISQQYFKMFSHFKTLFFSIRDIDELVKDYPDQGVCFSERIDELPRIALRGFRGQINFLVSRYESFRNWYNTSISNEILNRLSTKPADNQDALEKDLFLADPESFYYLFGDERCPLESVFTLNNYEIVNFGEDESIKETSINNINEIVNIICRQRLLLITGSYGGGKTTLLKRIHLECVRKGRPVYAFNAKDLSKLSSSASREMFDSFFGPLCRSETIFLIDSLDDLNIPVYENLSTNFIEYFITNMVEFMKKCKNVSFVVTTRRYARIGNSEITIPQKISLLYPSHMMVPNMKAVRTRQFKSADIDRWTDNYFGNGEGFTRRDVRRANGDILEPLRNPLFLYVFVKQYESVGKIKSGEGFFYYYEKFIEQTIKGKFKEEAPLGAQVVFDHVEEYRNLLQQVAFDILKTNSSTIYGLLNVESLPEPESLLTDSLLDYRFSTRVEKFSETTRLNFNQLSIRETDMANYVNCFFLTLIDQTIFFTDANIMFALASEMAFRQIAVLLTKEEFEIEDLEEFNLPGFFAPVIDYIIYKAESNNMAKKYRKYLRSFVLNRYVRSHLAISRQSDAFMGEFCSRILMLYVLFFKLNKGSLSGDYSGVFEDMVGYAKTLQALVLASCPGQNTRLYSIERFCARNCFSELTLSRIDLNGFNFKKSIIKNAAFNQCNLLNIDLTDIRIQGSVIFDLCSLNNAEILFAAIDNVSEIKFRDCSISEVKIGDRAAPNSSCKFTRCFIRQLTLEPISMKELFFDDCIIETVWFQGHSCNAANIHFRDCQFKTQVNCQGFRGRIYIEKGGSKIFDKKLFVNIDSNRVIDQREPLGNG